MIAIPGSGLGRMDRYRNFAELSRHEIEGRDYRIRWRSGHTRFAIVAPHGGKIERGTSPLADAIAGSEHTFYAFEGIKPEGNYRLHITSDRFDEPQALRIAGGVRTVITIHGARGVGAAVYTGGLDTELEGRILRALRAAGFAAAHDPSPTRQGRGVTNICNRGRALQGVQIELTQGLRKRLFDLQPDGTTWLPNDRFHVFVASVRAELADAQ